MPIAYEEAVDAYEQAAHELRFVECGLGNTHDETWSFFSARDALKEHPEFTGELPKTWYSGSAYEGMNSSKYPGGIQL